MAWPSPRSCLVWILERYHATVARLLTLSTPAGFFPPTYPHFYFLFLCLYVNPTFTMENHPVTYPCLFILYLHMDNNSPDRFLISFGRVSFSSSPREASLM
jgi:hypothetical protein